MFSFAEPDTNSGPNKTTRRPAQKNTAGGNFAAYDACTFSCACHSPVTGSGVDFREWNDHSVSAIGHRGWSVHDVDPACAFGNVRAERVLGNARSGHH